MLCEHLQNIGILSALNVKDAVWTLTKYCNTLCLNIKDAVWTLTKYCNTLCLKCKGCCVNTYKIL